MNEVKIKDISMPFLSMVWFMVKWSIAAVPAMLLLSIVGFLLSAVVIGTLGSM